MKNPSLLTSIFAGKIVAVLTIGVALSGIMPVESRAADEDGGSVVHLSQYSNDLLSVFMALKVADLIQKKGQKVALFVDLEGARLADKRLPNDLT